jgi:PAS domain S-box-containing protein
VGRRLYDPVDRNELRLRQPDGTHRLLRCRSVVQLGPGRHVCYLEDITDARAAEEAREAAERERAAARKAVENSEARFRTLSDGLPLVIWLGDAEGRTLYFNRYWYEYTGLPRDDEGRVEGAIHPDDLQNVLPLLRERRLNGEPLEASFRIRRHDGEYRWHLARSLSLRDDDGRVVRRLGSATEIEEERRTLERLRQERALRELFVAMLSHDLRSPLAAVKMGAQMMMLHPEDVATQAARIARNADQADRLIQNLLDASRIGAGEQLPLRREPCDLGAIGGEVIADLSAVHGPRFTLEKGGQLEGILDPGAVRRLLQNLLANAIKYGDGDKTVEVRLDGSGPDLVIAVHNHGNPIPPAERELIFTPYHRSRNTTAGWGLGLTLVRGVAEAHGGSVRVESGPATGTTFIVVLPRPGV